MADEYIDHQGKRLIGPLSLEAALQAAEPDGEVRMAVSCPNGDYVAVQFGNGLHVRRVNAVSGQGGTELGTGRWLDGSWTPSQWRPA